MKTRFPVILIPSIAREKFDTFVFSDLQGHEFDEITDGKNVIFAFDIQSYVPGSGKSVPPHVVYGWELIKLIGFEVIEIPPLSMVGFAVDFEDSKEIASLERQITSCKKSFDWEPTPADDWIVMRYVVTEN